MPVFRLESKTAVAGESFDIPLILESSTGVGKFKLIIEFDESFSLKSINDDYGFVVTCYDLSENQYVLNGTPRENYDHEPVSKAAVLSFSTKKEEGSGTVEIIRGTVYDREGVKTPVNGAECTVDIRSPLGKRIKESVGKRRTRWVIGAIMVLALALSAYYMIDSTEPFGHSYVHYDAKSPTCDGIGWDEYEICSKCGNTTYHEIPALGHEYESHGAKKPTCTETGWSEYESCVLCGCSTYHELSVIQHVYTSVNYNIVNNEDGNNGYICIYCGNTITVSDTVDSADSLWVYDGNGLKGTSTAELMSVSTSPGNTVEIPMVIGTGQISSITNVTISLSCDPAFTLCSVNNCESSSIGSDNGVWHIDCKIQSTGKYSNIRLVFNVDPNASEGDRLMHLVSVKMTASDGTQSETVNMDAVVHIGTQ